MKTSRFLSVFLTGTLPSPKETIKGNIKTVTEYKIDDDGKKIKVISDFVSKGFQSVNSLLDHSLNNNFFVKLS